MTPSVNQIKLERNSAPKYAINDPVNQINVPAPISMQTALRAHRPEYLIEGWALGCLMISIGSLVTAFGAPKSPIYALLPSAGLRTVFLAAAVGVSITLLIHSPWGKRSGAHMNPAITLAFLRLGKIRPWDALFYILAQIIGGTLGVVLVALFGGALFTEPPVHCAVTKPASLGAAVSFVASSCPRAWPDPILYAT